MRFGLEGFGHVEEPTLQEATDALVVNNDVCVDPTKKVVVSEAVTCLDGEDPTPHLRGRRGHRPGGGHGRSGVRGAKVSALIFAPSE